MRIIPQLQARDQTQPSPGAPPASFRDAITVGREGIPPSRRARRRGVPLGCRHLANRKTVGGCAQPRRIRRDASGAARSPRAVRRGGGPGLDPSRAREATPEMSAKFETRPRSAPTDAPSIRGERAIAARSFDLRDDCGDRSRSRSAFDPRRWRLSLAMCSFQSKKRSLKELDEKLIVALPLALRRSGESLTGVAAPRGPHFRAAQATSSLPRSKIIRRNCPKW